MRVLQQVVHEDPPSAKISALGPDHQKTRSISYQERIKREPKLHYSGRALVQSNLGAKFAIEIPASARQTFIHWSNTLGLFINDENLKTNFF